MGIPAQGDERLDASSSAGFHIGLAEIAVIGQHGFSLAQFFRQGAGLGQHWLELLLVVGGLNHIAKRKHTPEPVFGIIKSVLGFRQFLLRGLEKVKAEWTLVTLAWNMKRMFALKAA